MHNGHPNSGQQFHIATNPFYFYSACDHHRAYIRHFYGNPKTQLKPIQNKK